VGSPAFFHPGSGAPASGPVRPSPTPYSPRRGGGVKGGAAAAQRGPLTPSPRRGPLDGRWTSRSPRSPQHLVYREVCIQIDEEPHMARTSSTLSLPVVRDR